jgi:DNA-directed RNA polymerase specialized sigma24 family protein
MSENLDQLYFELRNVVSRVASQAKDPEDCEQEIWVEVIKAQQAGAVSEKLGSRISYCTKANQLRKFYRRKNLLEQLPKRRFGRVPPRSGEEIFIHAEELKRLHTILGSLSSSDQLKARVLTEEISIKEYADLERIGVGSAKKRMGKFESKLKTIFSEYQHDRD